MGERERLDQEYRNTVFWVELPRQYAALRIEQQDESLATYLRENEVGEWTLLTAWNPHSGLLTPTENRRRQDRLLARIAERGWVTLRGVGVGDRPDWPPEESILVLGLSRDEAKRLGREFGQNAILVGDHRGIPELLWCTEESGTA